MRYRICAIVQTNSFYNDIIMTSIRKAKKRIKRGLRTVDRLIDRYYTEPPTWGNLLALDLLCHYHDLQLERLNELKRKKDDNR